MTKYEILMDRMDYCSEKASENEGNLFSDDRMARFWKNASLGFQIKIENMSLEDAGRVCCIA